VLFFESWILADFREEVDHGKDGWRLAHQVTELSIEASSTKSQITNLKF